MEPLKIPSQTHSQTQLCCACTFILHEGARWENNQVTPGRDDSPAASFAPEADRGTAKLLRKSHFDSFVLFFPEIRAL